MKLKNGRELENSQRKRSELLRLIQKKEQSPSTSPASHLSLDSMKRMAQRLRAEIDEYERARQPS